MKKVSLLLAMLAVLCLTASHAVVVYQNDYEGQTVGAGAGGWNWSDNGGFHNATYQNYDGNIVIEHSGGNNNTTTAARNARFGSKWDITVSGNTSADPADYTISFDVRLVSASATSPWDPISEGLAVVTWAPGATSGDDQGHGYTPTVFGTTDGWVHVEFNLADWANNWWQGANWDLTQSRWSLEVGQAWPGSSIPAGASWTAVWLFDNLKIVMGSDTEPYDPNVTPINGDGTVGTLISQTQAQVTLGWNAGGDPNIAREYPVNPAILGHYIYLSNSGSDPNLSLLDYVVQVHNADPYLTDPYNEYGPITVDQGATYYWQVEEALDDGTGNPYGAGDPNNIMGQLWSFTTIAATPTILVGPANALADFSGNASFSVTGGPAATDYRWFKVGSPDIQLSDGGIYSDTQTATLVITGCTAADEGQFYCVAYNGDPDAGGIPSLPSNSAKLWYPRLVSHYPFETVVANATPDIISGFDAVMMQSGTNPLPGLNSTDAIVGTSCLQLDNPVSNDPNGQYAQIPAGVVDYADMTISVWIRPASIFGWSRAIDFGNGTSDYLFVTPDAGWGVMRFAIRTADINEQLLETGALTAGQWYHVAVTLSGDTGRMYRNGELVATNTGVTIDPIDVGAVLNYIGKSQWPDPEFNGLIDDLKIYNYALSTYDVAQEYLAVAGGSVCNYEVYDQQAYDTNGNCIIDLPDLASFAARWLENDRIYPE